MRVFWICVALILCFLSCACVPIEYGDGSADSGSLPTNSDAPQAPQKYKARNYDDVKAMWLSQYDLSAVYTCGGYQRSKSDFENKVKTILKNVSDIGINTVFVQVRPFADRFYPSEIYPVSSFVSGMYGRDMDYDPFAVILEEGHRLGLSVHAWINPLRAMTENEIERIPDSYLIRKWYDDAQTRGKNIVCVSGRWYLNPAVESVRRMVADGAAEIVRLYDVDGVHIDDYFYPTTDESFDSAVYFEYKSQGGELELADYRRSNINLLVSELYRAVKSENESVLFGVSPAGVMKNNYNTLYADVATWCEREGYIDYLCPQLYFGFEHSTCAFDKLCKEFSEMIKVDGIKLIFGMSLGKAKSEYDQYAGDGKYEWRDNKDILYRQLLYTKTIDNCSGVSYFCYQYFFDPLTGNKINETKKETDKFLPVLKIITWR